MFLKKLQFLRNITYIIINFFYYNFAYLKFKELIMSKNSIYLLPLCSFLFVLNGCSHAYNDDFGLVENYEADKQLEKEELSSKEELKKYDDELNSVTEFKPEKGTFLDKDWVQPEPTFTYHYDGDPKFYKEEELPENKGRLGNVIIKVPSSMTKEEVLSELGGV